MFLCEDFLEPSTVLIKLQQLFKFCKGCVKMIRLIGDHSYHTRSKV
jgi:hypothetical protein